MSFNRNQLNPNVWDIRGGSNQPAFNGGQQSLPSLFSPTNFHQQQSNQFMNHGNNFQNNPNNSYHQPIGSMFNSNEPSFNNNQYRKFNQNRPNRPGPAFRWVSFACGKIDVCLHFDISMKIAVRGIQCGRATCRAVATMITFPETHATLTPGGIFADFW